MLFTTVLLFLTAFVGVGRRVVAQTAADDYIPFDEAIVVNNGDTTGEYIFETAEPTSTLPTLSQLLTTTTVKSLRPKPFDPQYKWCPRQCILENGNIRVRHGQLDCSWTSCPYGDACIGRRIHAVGDPSVFYFEGFCGSRTDLCIAPYCTGCSSQGCRPTRTAYMSSEAGWDGSVVDICCCRTNNCTLWLTRSPMLEHLPMIIDTPANHSTPMPPLN